MSFDNFFTRFCSVLQEQGNIQTASFIFGNLPKNHLVDYVYYLAKRNKVIQCTPIYGGSNNHLVLNKMQNNYEELNNDDKLTFLNGTIALLGSNTAGSLSVYEKRASLLYSLGEYDDAMKDLDRILTKNQSYSVYEKKAECLLKLGDCEAAKRSIRKASKSLKISGLCETDYQKASIRLQELSEKVKNNHTPVEIARDIKRIPQVQTPNEEITYTSDSVRIMYTEMMGRHIVAARDIKPGEVIIVEEPYASVLLPEMCLTHCHHCLSRCLTLISCNKCSMALFCNEKCRNDAWKRNHRIECKVLEKLIHFGLDKMAYLTLRILMISTKQGNYLNKLYDEVKNYKSCQEGKKGFDLNGKYDSQTHISVYHLEGHLQNRTVASLFKKCTVVATLLHILQTDTSFFKLARKDLDEKCMKLSINGINEDEVLSIAESFVGELLLGYLCSISCNAHEVSQLFKFGDGSHKCEEIGAALYAVHSLINHSCDPNVVRHSYRDAVVLTSIQPIAANQQIFDNYGYHYAVHSKEERKESLKSQYYFDCVCNACVNDWPIYEYILKLKRHFITKDEKLITEYKISSKLFQKIMKDIYVNEMDNNHLELLYKHLELIHKVVMRPYEEYNKCQEAIKYCLYLQSNMDVSRN